MGYYLILVGGIISLFALWAIASHAKLLVLGNRTRGTIVGVDERLRFSGGRYKKIYYHPIVEFQLADGRPVTFTYGGASSRRRPTVGDQLAVVYNPDSPGDATVNSFAGIWAGPLAVTVLGGATLYVGIRMVCYPG